MQHHFGMRQNQFPRSREAKTPPCSNTKESSQLAIKLNLEQRFRVTRYKKVLANSDPEFNLKSLNQGDGRKGTSGTLAEVPGLRSWRGAQVIPKWEKTVITCMGQWSKQYEVWVRKICVRKNMRVQYWTKWLTSPPNFYIFSLISNYCLGST